MPIQFPNFQRISFGEANPALVGSQIGMNLVGQGQDTIAKLLAQKKLEAELPYAGEMAKNTSAYKEAMARYLSSPNQALKYMSGLGKTYVEPGIVQAILKNYGVSTGSNPIEGFNYQPQPGQVESQGGIQDTYNLQRQKMTTDTDTRKRNLFASNLEKTLQYIDPDSLSRYSGITGSLNKLFEKGKSATGNASKEYQDYAKSMNAAKFLAKQVRQFYGASITPEMDSQLQQISNPESWSNDPKLTKELFFQFKDLLKNELQTYRDALKSTKPYEGSGNNHSTENLPITEQAIQETATKYKISTDQVRKLLGIK